MLYIFICVWFGIAGGVVGRMKGSSFFLWFVISAVLPGLGLLAAVLSRRERDEPMRACPGCGRVLKLHDALCTRCGTELEFTEETVVAGRPVGV